MNKLSLNQTWLKRHYLTDMADFWHSKTYVHTA